MKKRMLVLMAMAMISTTIVGCSGINVSSAAKVEENTPSIEVTSEPIVEENKIDSIKLLKGFEAWEDSEAIRALNQALSFQRTITEVSRANMDSENLLNEEYYLNEVNTMLDYKFDKMLLPEQYTVVDLDQDGIPEVVVTLSSGTDGWIKVLRYYEGTVYSYSFTFRGFESPKVDGTYFASSGAMDNVIMNVSFDGVNIIEHSIASSVSSDDKVKFYIGNEEVTEEDYNVLLEKYNGIEDVTWYQFQ